MSEMTLRGEATDDAARTVRVLIGFRWGGKGYAPGTVTSFPGRVARELVLHGRVMWAERPAVVKKPVEAPKPIVAAAPPPPQAPVPHIPLVEIRRVGHSRWYEIVSDGVVVAKKNGLKAAEAARDALLAGGLM